MSSLQPMQAESPDGKMPPVSSPCQTTRRDADSTTDASGKSRWENAASAFANGTFYIPSPDPFAVANQPHVQITNNVEELLQPLREELREELEELREELEEKNKDIATLQAHVLEMRENYHSLVQWIKKNNGDAATQNSPNVSDVSNAIPGDVTTFVRNKKFQERKDEIDSLDGSFASTSASAETSPSDDEALKWIAYHFPPLV